MSHLAVPLALAILAVLFAVQRSGTAVVGRVFGPVMVLWFAAIGAVGAREVAAHPDIVRGLAPSYAVEFVGDHPGVAFVAMGAVMLAITGAEALYADMGHFGRPPIRRAWFWLVFPALTLNYLGQSGLILRRPDAIESPFFLLVPEWSRIPMVVLATAATVIASQAVISGAFSLSRQAVQLGFLPRLAIRHTPQHTVGQILRSGGQLDARHRVRLLRAARHRLWRGRERHVPDHPPCSSSPSRAGAGTGRRGGWRSRPPSSCRSRRRSWQRTSPKIQHGGWLPLVIAGGVFTLIATWHRGSEIVNANRRSQAGPLREFVAELHAMEPPVPRVPGTAVFLNPSMETTPLALRANFQHHHVRGTGPRSAARRGAA